MTDILILTITPLVWLQTIGICVKRRLSLAEFSGFFCLVSKLVCNKVPTNLYKNVYRSSYSL